MTRKRWYTCTSLSFAHARISHFQISNGKMTKNHKEASVGGISFSTDNRDDVDKKGAMKRTWEKWQNVRGEGRETINLARSYRARNLHLKPQLISPLKTALKERTKKPREKTRIQSHSFIQWITCTYENLSHTRGGKRERNLVKEE